jgi:multidrug efflux pump
VISVFSADRSVLAIGVTIMTAQLTAMIANGFTGLITSFFQPTGSPERAEEVLEEAAV